MGEVGDPELIQAGQRDPEAIYKIAGTYAIGDPASALRALRHSIGNGFFSYPYFITDPLLESLHKDAEFKALMEVARRRYDAFKSTFF